MKPREEKYFRVCVMCGVVFSTARPESATCLNVCRSRLRRWRALYKCDPLEPPGKRLQPGWSDRREDWYRKYLPKNHPKNKPAPKSKRK